MTIAPHRIAHPPPSEPFGGGAIARAETEVPVQVAPAHFPPASGSAPTFESLYDAHFAFVWRSARRLGVPPTAIDDVVQDVFLVVHRRLATFEQRGQYRTWLFGILRRVIADHRRTQRRKPAGSVAPADLDRLHAIEGRSDDAKRLEAAQMVGVLLDQLDDDKREVFVLAELEQMTLAEVAETLGINRNTAWSRLRAARSAFEAALARLEGDVP